MFFRLSSRELGLELLERSTDASIALSEAVPGSKAATAAIADGEGLQPELRGLAGDAIAGSPDDSAPRLYVETLNEMIDMQTVRVAGAEQPRPFRRPCDRDHRRRGRARPPRAVPRDPLARLRHVVLAAGFVSVLLLITFDLDRPGHVSCA